MEIRDGRPDDYQRIKEIKYLSVKHSYDKFISQEEMDKYLGNINEWNLNEILTSEGNFLRVCIDAKEFVLGFILACHHLHKKVTYIDEIRVDPTYQGKGIGSRLMDDLHFLSPFECIILDVDNRNTLAYNFYIKKSYVPIEYYRDRILMHYKVCDKDHCPDKSKPPCSTTGAEA